jgi:hypothetical protein
MPETPAHLLFGGNLERIILKGILLKRRYRNGGHLGAFWSLSGGALQENKLAGKPYCRFRYFKPARPYRHVNKFPELKQFLLGEFH